MRTGWKEKRMFWSTTKQRLQTCRRFDANRRYSVAWTLNSRVYDYSVCMNRAITEIIYWIHDLMSSSTVTNLLLLFLPLTSALIALVFTIFQHFFCRISNILSSWNIYALDRCCVFVAYVAKAITIICSQSHWFLFLRAYCARKHMFTCLGMINRRRKEKNEV